MKSKLIACFIILISGFSCSSDDTSSPESQPNTSIETPDDTDDTGGDDQGNDNDTNDFVIPEIAIVGNTFEMSSSLFLIDWDETYENSTITNIKTELNNETLSYFTSSKGYFYISDFDFGNPLTYKYSFSDAAFEEFDSSEYLVTQATSPFQRVRPYGDYIITYIEDNGNPFDNYLHSYNVVTGLSQEFYLGTGSIAFSNASIRGYGDYAFVLYDAQNSGELTLRIFNLLNGQELSLDYSQIVGLVYNEITDELLIAQEQGCGILNYDILNLETFTFNGEGSFSDSICLADFFLGRTNSFNDRVVFNISPEVNSSNIGTPYIYNYTTQNRELLVLNPILDAISNQTDFNPGGILAVNVELETETIIIAFNYNDPDNNTNGGIAFLTYDFQVKEVVDTGDVLTKDIVLK